MKIKKNHCFSVALVFIGAGRDKTKKGFWVPGSDHVTYQAFVERNPGREEPTIKPVSEVSRSQRCKPRGGGDGNGKELRAVGRWHVVGA